MKRLLYIIIGIAYLSTAKAQAPLLPDTLDEEELQAMRDTATMSRRNLAADTKTVNLRDYIVKDIYTPTHQSFSNAWYSHLYVGGSLGIEQIQPQVDDYECRFISNVNLLLGKQLNIKSDLRLSLGAGQGYEKHSDLYLKRLQGRLDYIYNLSTHYQGYNPARRMEVSLLGGIGANYVWNSNPKYFAPEAHVGLQLKCVTGPMGTINIEPYVGVSSDKIDMSGTRNWRRYDAIYGVNINYSFFLDDNLNKESRDKLLRSRMAGDRLINAYTLEKWRTPWFFEYASGIAFATSSHMDFAQTLGTQTSLGIGRWLSPVMGFRLSAFTRSTRWLEERPSSKSLAMKYHNSNYIGGRLEGLFNPFGFAKSFRWDAPVGAYLTFGYGMGVLRKFNDIELEDTRSEMYSIGTHIWGRVTDNMQVFIEPRFGRNVYIFSDPIENPYYSKQSFMGDNALTVEAGFTMLIRSQKYKNPKEMDHTQNYTYRNIRGFRIGASAGMPIFQNDLAYYSSHAFNYNASLAFEYRFNRLHSLRLTGDYMGLSFKDHKLNINNKDIVFGSLDYEVSLTNLFAGRLVGRNLEVEAFIGPTAAVITHTKVGEDNLFFGGNTGFKLSYHVWNGIYAVVTPQMYLIKDLPYFKGLTAMALGNLHLVQTMNIGVQYKIGKLHLNKEKVRRNNRIKDARWKERQTEKLQKLEAKQAAKVAKRYK